MAVNDAIGTSLYIDYSNFAQGITQANKLIKLNQAQFEAATAGMDDWSKTSDGLDAKLKQLNSNLEIQKKKVSALSDEYEKVKNEKGENSKSAIDLATKLAKEQAALAKTQKEINKTGESLKGLSSDTISASKDTEELKNSLKDIGDKTVKGILSVGAAVGGLAAAFLATAEKTKEYRQQMGQLDTAFSESGLRAQDAKNTYSDLFSVLGDSGKANEASLQLAKLSKNEKDLRSYTTILTGVYATFGDSLPVEGLAEAMNHTAKLGSVQGNLADALEWSGVNVDDFNANLEKMNSEEELSAYIQSTLNGLYGATAETYKETNAGIIESNRVQQELNDTMARVGELAEPIINDLKTMGAELAEKLLPILEKTISFIKDNKDVIVGILAGITTGIIAYTVATKAMVIATNIAKIAQIGLNAVLIANPIGLIVTAIGALVAAIVVLWKKSETFRNFVITVFNGIKYALGVYLLAIVSAFYAAVDGIKAAWSGIKEFFIDIGTSIKNTFTAAVDGVKAAWSGIKEFFSTKKTEIVETFKELPEKFKTVGKDIIEGLWTGINNMTAWLKDKISGFSKTVLNGIKDFFGVHSPSTETTEIGEYLAEGLENGIKNGTASVVKTAKKQADTVIEGFRDEFGVHSASTETTEIGEYLGEGLENGIKNSTDNVVKTAKDQAEQVVDSMYDNIVEKMGSDSKVVSTIGYLLGKNIKKATSSAIEESTDNTAKTGTSIKVEKTSKENGIKDGTEYGDGFSQGIQSKTANVQSILSNMLSANNFESLLTGDFLSLGSSLGDSLISGLGSIISLGNPVLNSLVTGLIGGVWNVLKSGFNKIFGKEEKEESTYKAPETRAISNQLSYLDSDYKDIAGSIHSINDQSENSIGLGSRQIFVLNQTNNSPKSLSTAEIYRNSNKAIRLLAQGARA